MDKYKHLFYISFCLVKSHISRVFTEPFLLSKSVFSTLAPESRHTRRMTRGTECNRVIIHFRTIVLSDGEMKAHVLVSTVFAEGICKKSPHVSEQ